MPEIAEVTLMADAIRSIALNRCLLNIEIFGGKYLNKGLDNLDQLRQDCPLIVESVNVKGKLVWMQLEHQWFILITFGMSGAIRYHTSESVSTANRFHLKFCLSEDQCFYFHDPRQFGNIIITHDQLVLNSKLSKLGPDMLTGPELTDSQFINIFRQSKFCSKNICCVLMCQEAISGIGNYLKAEILYRSRINPWVIVSDLDDQTLINLYHCIRETTQMAYQNHGASLYTYTGVRNEKGNFQDMLYVYNKKTDPNGYTVVRIPDHQSPDKRTTYYVPMVQIIGSFRDPNYGKIESTNQPKVNLKLKLKLKPNKK